MLDLVTFPRILQTDVCTVIVVFAFSCLGCLIAGNNEKVKEI